MGLIVDNQQPHNDFGEVVRTEIRSTGKFILPQLVGLQSSNIYMPGHILDRNGTI
jgi:hypothetical protein